MNKFQVIAVVSAVAITALLFFAGNTVDPGKKNKQPQADSSDHNHFDIQSLEKQVVSTLSPGRQQFLEGLDADVKRGDVQAQKLASLKGKAHFYHDSVAVPALHYHYLSEASLLENTEKSLTFAGHSILEYLPYAENGDQQHWLADAGKQLFDKALAINPNNDSSIVAQSAFVMYGAHSDEGPMAAIMKMREVAQRDSTNMFAQYMLGMGGVISGQTDKAIGHFEKVAAAQPDNLEVMFRIAELYERQKQKNEAIAWYRKILDKVDRAELRAEINKRIQLLEK